MEWNPIKVRAALGEMDEPYMWMQRGRRAYCGWLACNPQFVAEHDALWAASLPQLRRFGIPQMGPAAHDPKSWPRASLARQSRRDLLLRFEKFLRKWIFAQLPGPRLPYPFAVLIMLAFTGMRVGEAMALRPVDVDLKEGWIHVRRRGDWGPKTEGSERTIPIHRRLLAVLLAGRKRVGDKWFFHAPPSRKFPSGNNHINPREANEQFQALAKECGLTVSRKEQGLTLHSLRRFFKTFCLDAGVPKPMVDFWMGHRDQKNMDTFYYDPIKSNEWMEKVPFGEPNEEDIRRLLAAATRKSAK